MVTADRPDADDLVVRAALGEPLTEAEQQWLAEDPELRAEVAQMAEIVDLARTAPEEVASDDQLDGLWDGIAAEAFGRAPQPAPATERAAGAHDVPDRDDDGGEVVPLGRSSGPWVALTLLGAAAAVIAAVVVVVRPWADEAAQPVAAAELAPLEGVEAEPVEGQFVVDDGTQLLQLDLSALPDRPDAFYEVWLLDPDTMQMVSLGPARPDGAYALPNGVEAGDYPTVDVSVEPQDGDPAHSGDSVLRGPVRA